MIALFPPIQCKLSYMYIVFWHVEKREVNIMFYIGQSHETSDDIDLNDPEVNKAAVKIQASYRGHLTRKNLQQ